MQTPPLSDAERAALEQTYAQLLSSITLLARLLGKPSPVVAREERRRQTVTDIDPRAILSITHTK